MDFIYQHIQNVLRALNIENYFYESVFISVSSLKITEISAHNELYFLIGNEFHLSNNQRGFLMIVADNDLAELDSDCAMQNPLHTQQFNGSIVLSLKPYGYLSAQGSLQAPIDGKCILNFIKVTPIPNSNENTNNSNQITQANS